MLRNIDGLAINLEKIGGMVKILRMAGKQQSVRLDAGMHFPEDPVLGGFVEIDHDISTKYRIKTLSFVPPFIKQV